MHIEKGDIIYVDWDKCAKMEALVGGRWDARLRGLISDGPFKVLSANSMFVLINLSSSSWSVPIGAIYKPNLCDNDR